MNQSQNAKNQFSTMAILGRQPALGIAELESLLGAEQLQPIGSQCCLLNCDPEQLPFSQLGGSVRIAKVLFTIASRDWAKIEERILDKVPTDFIPFEGKLTFGISVVGMPIPAKKISKTALLLKKALKQTGQSVRMVPHTSTELGSATVLYNKLTAEHGMELLITSDGVQTYVAKTFAIQDIDAYAARDQARPHRDAKVGMLPPKLAQIILNLARGGSKKLDTSLRVLDPFCGTGVVLQEAMLMDYDIYGSDLEPRMVQYSIDNLNWLDNLYPEVGDYRRVEIGNATKHRWDSPEKIDIVACETYLGQPLTQLPNSEHLSKIMHEVNALHHRFLQNIGSQVSSGTRFCLAIPTWRGKREFLHLSTLDYLQDLGYTRVRFKHVADKDLIYHRDGQVVGRELLVIEKR